MRTVSVLISIFLLLSISGCSRDVPIGTGSGTENGVAESAQVLHIVMATEGLQPDQYEVAIAPWKMRTYREVWIDQESGDVRENSLSTPTTTQIQGDWGQEILKSGNIVTTVDISESPDMSDIAYPASAWVSDADTASVVPRERADPLLISGDPNIYRSLALSGEAQVSDEGSDTTLLTLDRDGRDDAETIHLKVTVNSESYLPVELLGEVWRTDTAEFAPEQAVFARWITRYEMVEIVQQQDVPEGTFSLPLAEGTAITVDRTLSLKETAVHEDPQVYWLGQEWRGFQMTSGPRLQTTSVSPQFFSPNRLNESTRRGADDIMPLTSPEMPSVTIEYGDEHSGPTVYSTSRFSIKKAAEIYIAGPAFDVETRTIDGRDAVSIIPTDGMSVVWIAVDMPDATVILQGWQMTLDETLAAAEALVRVGTK